VNRLRALLGFIWEFVVGDDWQLAAGVVLALAATALLSGGDVSAWWILPLCVAALLVTSVWRAGRARR
jgi:hypothetical protein